MRPLPPALPASPMDRGVEQSGDRFGAGATGVPRSAPGNLPELFIGLFALRSGLFALRSGLFALRSGLVDVVRAAAIIGSVLAATVNDGEFDRLEGATLTALYLIIATAVHRG